MSYLEIIKSNNKKSDTINTKYVFQHKKSQCCSTQHEALMSEHIECMKLLIKCDGGIDPHCIKINSPNSVGFIDTVNGSIIRNKVKIFKYFRSNGYYSEWNNYTNNIEQYVYPEIFEIIKKFQYPIFTTQNLPYARIELVKHLYEKYKKTDGITIYDAIQSGRKDILMWGIENKFPFEKEKCFEVCMSRIKEIKEMINDDDKIESICGEDIVKNIYEIMDFFTC